MYRASIENRNTMHSKTRKPTNLTQISQGKGTKCIELDCIENRNTMHSKNRKPT